MPDLRCHEKHSARLRVSVFAMAYLPARVRGWDLPQGRAWGYLEQSIAAATTWRAGAVRSNRYVPLLPWLLCQEQRTKRKRTPQMLALSCAYPAEMGKNKAKRDRPFAARSSIWYGMSMGVH